MALDNRHHAFLQSLMSRGPLPDDVAKITFQTLFKVQNDQLERQFFEFLGVYNKQLDFFQLEIRGSRNQYDGSLHFGLVNKQADEQSKLGTHYSYAQIAYFKTLVEAIAQEPSGELSSIAALNLHVDHFKDQASQQEAAGLSSQQSQVTATSNLTLAQRDGVLQAMVSDKWLSRTDQGISLGIKSFLELRSVFNSLDVPCCDVCNDAGIKAMRCSNPECSTRMHVYCAKLKFSRPGIPRVCQSCGTDWDCEELELPQHVSKSKPSSSAKRKVTKRTRRSS